MVVKEKKTAKGHFKAPPFSKNVLRARAQVAAPTVSTAADVSKLPPPLENDPPPAPPPMATAVSGGASTSESKAVKVITAKRAKELEREAKEKEFADGQHANFIDGVWHCSNCGCPENIAIGRRKGPLGDKSQCGTCGTFLFSLVWGRS
jgi:SWI/SNF-related matrix-associated actin-dependent regulator of chromatin subfamily B protein 1